MNLQPYTQNTSFTRPQMWAFRQHSELFPTTTEAPFLLEGTSSAGFSVKKSAGRIMSWKISTGLDTC